VPWVKIEDVSPDHPKLARLSPAGYGLWVAGICYCNRNLTDGFIPDSMARRILGVDQDVVDGLVMAGVWELVDGGYLVHDYLEHQQSRAEILDARGKAAERARKYRASRRDSRVTHGVRTEKSHDLEVEVEREEVSPSGDTHKGAQIDEVWAVYQGYSSRSVLSPARRQLIQRRLKSYPVDVLVAAIHGNRADQWHAERGKHELEYVFREGNIDRFAEQALANPIERIAAKRNLSSRDIGELARVLEEQEGGHHDGIGSGQNRGAAAGFLPEGRNAA
jgi:hypothetical protein